MFKQKLKTHKSVALLWHWHCLQKSSLTYLLIDYGLLLTSNISPFWTILLIVTSPPTALYKSCDLHYILLHHNNEIQVSPWKDPPSNSSAITGIGADFFTVAEAAHIIYSTRLRHHTVVVKYFIYYKVFIFIFHENFSIRKLSNTDIFKIRNLYNLDFFFLKIAWNNKGPTIRAPSCSRYPD